MKYKIEFELPDNETVLKGIKTSYVQWGIWGYSGMATATPSAEPEDWMERNKERILQAGIEGREIEFRIGGRLFAIREKAQ